MVETEETLTSAVGPAGGTRPVCLPDGAVQLPLALPQQERARWCWAAIGVALVRFLSGQEITQTTVAALTDDPSAGEGDGCNQPLDRVLDHLGLLAHWSPGKPRYERLVFDINRGLPVPLRIEWFGGDAHFVMVTGYHPADRTLLIDDPLHGPSRCPYDRFPRDYRQGGVWTDTIRTRMKGEFSHGHV